MSKHEGDIASEVIQGLARGAALALVASAIVFISSSYGCAKPAPKPEPIDWDAVAPSVVVEVVPDDAAEAPIEPIPDPAPDEGLPEAPVEALESTEPVGAHVAMGPGTDTLSVSDDEGKLPADPGFAKAAEPIVEPTTITIVSDVRTCPPCIQMERDGAAAAIKRRWPACRVFTVRPVAGESMPTLRIEFDGREPITLTAFYSTTIGTKQGRLDAMFAAIEAKIREAN